MNLKLRSFSLKITKPLQIFKLLNWVCFAHHYDIILKQVFQGCQDMILQVRDLFQLDRRIWANIISFLFSLAFQVQQCNRVQQKVSNSSLHFYSLYQFQVLGLINLKPHQQSKVKSHNFTWRNLMEFHPF